MSVRRHWFVIVVGMVVLAGACASNGEQQAGALPAPLAPLDMSATASILRTTIRREIEVEATAAAQATTAAMSTGLYLTATEIISRATATAWAMNDPLRRFVRSIVSVFAPPSTPTPPFQMNPLEITATAIIVRATMTQSANLTATQETVIRLTAEAIARTTMTQAANLIVTYETLLGSLTPPSSATPVSASN